MACSIKQDDKGKVTGIDYKGIASKLYPKLVDIVPNNAVFKWAETRTKAFTDWYGSTEEPEIKENDVMHYYENSKKEIKILQMKGNLTYERTEKEKSQAELEWEDKIYQEALEIIGDNPIYKTDEKAWELRKSVISEFQKLRKFANEVIIKAWNNISKDPTTGKFKSKITDAFQTITNEENGLLGLFLNKKGAKRKVKDPVTGKVTWEKDDRTYLERERDMVFEDGRLTTPVLINKVEEKLDKDQYLVHLQNQRIIAQDRGKVTHGSIQKEFARSKEERDALDAEVSRLIVEGAERRVWHKSQFDWLEGACKELKSRWNLSTLDTVHFEQVIYSEILNIAGKADAFIRYEDGRIGIRDLKTSKSLRTDFLTINNLMKYGNTSIMEIENSRLNQAKLQVFLYAFVAKTETPEIKFKNLGIDWVANPHTFYGTESDITLTPREIKAFMEMIDALYKEQQSNNENSIYSLINKNARPDLWNIDHYTLAFDETKDLLNDDKDFEEDEFERRLHDIKMAVFYDDDETRYKENAYKSYSDKAKALKARREKMMKDMEWIYDKASGSNNYLKNYDQDLSLLTKYFSTTADTRNQIIDLYERFRISQMEKYHKEWNRNLGAFEMLSKDALNSMRKRKGQPLITEGNNILGLGDWVNEYFSNYDYEELWGWAYKTIETKDGRTLELMKTIEDFNNASELTAEQKKLGIFLNNYYTDWFKDKEGKKAYMNQTVSFTIDSNGKETGLTNLDVYNGKMESQIGAGIDKSSFSWAGETEFEDIDGKKVKGMWFPKVSMTEEEIFKKEGISNVMPYTSSKWWTNYLRKTFTTFYEEQEKVTGEDQVAGLPMRFLGTPTQKMNRSYSKNIAQQFALFGMHTTRKQHMDVVYAWGKATVSYLRESVRYGDTHGEKLKNVADFLESNIRHQLTNKDLTKEYKWFGREIRFKGGIFSPKKLIMFLRNQATRTLMILNPINAFVNWLQTINRSIIAGWAESASHNKLVGTKGSPLFSTAGNFTKGYANYWTMQESLIKGGKDGQRNKTYVLAKQFGFLPDNAEWSTNNVNVLGRSMKAFHNKGSFLYMLNRVPEEANAMAQLEGQLRTMTLDNPDNTEFHGKSLFDCYKMVDEEVEINGVTVKMPVMKWIAGERGTRTVNGKKEILRELAAEEIIKLRNVYKTLQGGYRHDEKTLLEMTILGELFMQFKKFLPALFKVNLQTEAEDLGMGNFERNSDGELIWVGRATEGRWWTLARLVQTYSGIAATKIIPQKLRDVLGLKLGFDKQLRWSEMTDYQKYSFFEWIITLAIWAPMALLVAAKAKTDKDDDSYLKLLRRISDNVIMPYSPNQMWQVAADSRPVAIKLMQRRVSGYSQLVWSTLLLGVGDEEGAYTQQGNLKGLKESLQTTPITSTPYQIHKFLENKSMDLEDLITWSPR